LDVKKINNVFIFSESCENWYNSLLWIANLNLIKMKKVKTLLVACAIATSTLLSLPVTAQNGANAQTTNYSDNNDNDHDGYVSPWWGLLGLIGLFGLMRNRDKYDTAKYDTGGPRTTTR
jgi:hypothetical protein